MHPSRPRRRRDRIERSASEIDSPELVTQPPRPVPRRRLLKPLILGFLILYGLSWGWSNFVMRSPLGQLAGDLRVEEKWPPLVMRGGDPYIRALMRTISASESNYPHPYHVIYGGKYAWDLSRHPDRCVTIVAGPNRGRCTTAAGRYQFLSSTWEQMADRYHPKPARFWVWQPYSFEAEYQDLVVYRWLLDEAFWDADISGMLRRGQLDEVLKLLSGTWTSLGYGIEDNLMTSSLPRVYEQVLQDELYTFQNSGGLEEADFSPSN